MFGMPMNGLAHWLLFGLYMFVKFGSCIIVDFELCWPIHVPGRISFVAEEQLKWIDDLLFSTLLFIDIYGKRSQLSQGFLAVFPF